MQYIGVNKVMASSPKNHGDKSEDGVTVALKLPGGRSNETRQVATAFSKWSQALRSSSVGSSGGRSRASVMRQRGLGAAGSAVVKAANGKGGVLGVAAKPLPLQRVAVRWSYVGNKGDGQWGAHGKYLERESAQEKELSREELERLAEQEKVRELDGPLTISEKGQDHERSDTTERGSNGEFDRYADAPLITEPGRVSALRQSYVAALGKASTAKSINDLRSLSSLGMVQRDGRRAELLQSDAPDFLGKRRAENADRVRRGSGRESGAHSATNGIAKKRALGFGSDGAAVAIAETLDRWQQAGDDRMFKIIVSPEFGERLDMRSLIKRHVGQMEKDLGTKLQWVAQNHYNTDDPHAHVAIRGIDDRGRTLEISPEYIAQGSRIRAQEIATRDLGFRQERDVAAALERQVGQQRFTDLDRTLLKMGNEQGSPNIDSGLLRLARANARGEVDYSGKPPADPTKRALRLAQVERLAFLEKHGLATRVGEMKWSVNPDLAKNPPDSSKVIRFDTVPPINAQARDARLKQIRRLAKLTEMGLAEQIGNLTWQLKPSLESALRQIQKSQDRLKTKAEHREMISDPNAPLVMTELKSIGQRVSGKVVGTGLDEGSSKPYILIEGLDGKVHYVNQPFQVQKMRGDGDIKAGDYIAVGVVERKDRAGKVTGTTQKVENFGRSLSAQLLDAELLATGAVVMPGFVKGTVASAYRDAAAARLNVLESAGAVTVSDGRIAAGSALAHDRIRFADAGIKTDDFAPAGPVLATVVAKGAESIVVAPTVGRKQVITAVQLQAMGVDQKYIGTDSNLFIGTDTKGKAVAAVIKPAQVPVMVSDMRANRLDSMVQQLSPIQVPKSHPLALALAEREALWAGRGVDMKRQDFALRANVWRKGAELQAAAMKEGVENVIEGLAREKGKPVRFIEAEPGRQVSGRVVLVQSKDGFTNVVLDSGSQLTHLRVPDSESFAGKAGDRLRAKAESINAENTQQRVSTWRFADLEREAARSKGREGKAF